MDGVSVIIITKNEEKNIAECLKSLQEMEYENNCEILVCDSSSDKTPEIVHNFPNAKLIYVEKSGYGAARNAGLSVAKYSHVAFIDADCIAPKGWLATITNSINGFSGIGGCAYPPKNSSYIGRCIACLGYPAGGALGAEILDGTISTCNALFEKSALVSIGGFREDLRSGGEDTDLSRRLHLAGFKTKIEKNSFVWHKTRTFKNFLGWCFKRGIAKYSLEKSPLQLAMPLSVIAYPFSRRFMQLAKRRKSISMSLASIMTVVVFLFFLRQVMLSAGWLAGFWSEQWNR